MVANWVRRHSGVVALASVAFAAAFGLGACTDTVTNNVTDTVFVNKPTYNPAPDSAGGFLGRRCGSPEIDRLAERGRAETTPVQRHALYRQVEETMAREALLLPLFHEQAYRFAQPDVGGLNVSFGIPLVAYEELHLRG